jgi:hypothetical protein
VVVVLVVECAGANSELLDQLVLVVLVYLLQ